jgi:hypothetical protein
MTRRLRVWICTQCKKSYWVTRVTDAEMTAAILAGDVSYYQCSRCSSDGQAHLQGDVFRSVDHGS